MTIVLEIKGLEELRQKLQTSPAAFREASIAALTRCAIRAHRDAVANAPRSPSQEEFDGIVGQPGGNKKKTPSKRKFTPGGLERSIAWSVDTQALEATVHVSASSEAASYAEKIHDGDYNLGVGSRNKSAAGAGKVGPKFITRAIEDNAGYFKNVLRQETNKALEKYKLK